MLVVAVGTFLRGFDELVASAECACAQLGLQGFAQIGHGRLVPSVMAWQRFLPQADLAARFAAARVVVCHAGMGIVAEAMRAGAPIVLFPRTGATRAGHPANDQAAFAARIAARHGLELCRDGAELPAILARVLRGPARRDYEVATDVPALLADWLSRAGQRR